MFVQLSIELITKAIKLFCKKNGVEMKAKDVEKILSSLVEDDSVEKHFFCGATCVKSKRTCMKEVDDEDAHCYVHDPDRKCKGTTIKGENCRSVAKVGEDYCHRHHDQGGRSGKGKATKQPMKRELIGVNKSFLRPDDSSEEEEPPKKKKSKESKPVVSSEDEENVSEEEETRKKRGKKAKCKEPSDDESVSNKESSSDEEPPKEKQSKKHDRKKHAKHAKHVPSDDEQSGEDEALTKKSSSKKRHAKKVHTSEDVTTDEDTSADEAPKKKRPNDATKRFSKKNPAKKHAKKGYNPMFDDCSSEESSAEEDEAPKKKVKKVKHESSSDESAEEGESQIQPSPDRVDVTLDNIAPAMTLGWIVHPNNNKLEYSCNYTINGKCIVKMAMTNAFVGLCTVERVNGDDGDEHVPTIEEESILEKINLRAPTLLEQKQLYQQESEEESSSQAESAAEEEDDDKYGDEDNPPKWTVEMVDAYKEHPDVLWRILKEFREQVVAEVQKQFSGANQPKGKGYDAYSRIINDTIDLQKKIKDGNGMTYEGACKLEEKLKKFNNVYAHRFMVLDLAIVASNFRKQIVGNVTESTSDAEDEEEIHVGRPEDKSKVKWKAFDEYLEYSMNLLVGGKHLLKKRKENIGDSTESV
jgi:hypothetical protein